MIERLWHGWTTAANADAWEQLLKTEVFPSIAAKQVRGYRGIRLLRRPLPGGETEFTTIMSFDPLEAVRSFAGDDYEPAYVPPKARTLLAHLDQRASHYEVREQLIY